MDVNNLFEGRSMRPNHQNKRMRGRNRGGGKGPNPLSRSYESNGPDVKIRGTAQHIAEKYVQLGRDAQATGDHVAAESYFQHAEHYFRLIAAAQEQLRQQNPQYRPYEMGGEGDMDEGDEDSMPFGHGAPQPDVRFPGQSAQGFDGDAEPAQQRGFAPQGQREPRDFQPREGRDYQPREGRDYQPRDQREFQPRDRRDFQPREPREPRDFQPREPREGRDYQAREPRDFQPREGREFQPREPRFPRSEQGGDRGPRGPRPERERPVPDDAPQPEVSLPAFITAPVRPLPPVESELPEPVVPAEAEGEEARFPLRTRRRRGRPAREDDASAAPATDETPAGE
jgi:hypothetical protein